MASGNVEIKVNVADMEPVKAALATAIELGNAVESYFDAYGYNDRNKDRLPYPDRVMWDALEKWRGLYR